MSKPVTPTLGAKSFSCPHCTAMSAQTWFMLLLDNFEKNQRPQVFSNADVDRSFLKKMEDGADRNRWIAFFDRFEKNEVTYEYVNYGRSDARMVNMWLSRCYSCDAFTVWVKDQIVWPETESTIVIPEDLPGVMRAEVEEARNIIDKSPRGAAALLRLAIQNMMPVLDIEEDNLDKAIGALVKKGLDPAIQQAFDVVRIVGNNSVHPGQIDMKDNKEMALKLFTLIDMIVENMITRPNQLKALYGEMPPGALKAIEKRDGPKAIEDKSGSSGKSS